MRVVNLGSLNLDKVYGLKKFVSPGETLMTESYDVSYGGKGLNQSVALARAGTQVFHIGMVGADGKALVRQLEDDGVNIENIFTAECDSGHAVIQVNADGQNCIIVSPGANAVINEAMIDEVFDKFSTSDIFLTQNETSCVAYAIKAANSKGMKVVLNPSPITNELLKFPLQLVDIFILNEIEGAMLSGCDAGPREVLKALSKRFPNGEFVLTVGEEGAYYKKGETVIFQPAYRVKAIDTTGAGDTFTGFFLASIVKGESAETSLKNAAIAATLAVGRKGAASSVPTWEEMQSAVLEQAN